MTQFSKNRSLGHFRSEIFVAEDKIGPMQPRQRYAMVIMDHGSEPASLVIAAINGIMIRSFYGSKALHGTRKRILSLGIDKVSNPRVNHRQWIPDDQDDYGILKYLVDTD